MGEWSHLRLVGTMRWTKIDVALVHSLFYGRIYNRDYQQLYEKRSHFSLKKKKKSRLMSRDLKNKIAKFFKILVFKGKIGFNF